MDMNPLRYPNKPRAETYTTKGLRSSAVAKLGDCQEARKSKIASRLRIGGVPTFPCLKCVYVCVCASIYTIYIILILYYIILSFIILHSIILNYIKL